MIYKKRGTLTRKKKQTEKLGIPTWELESPDYPDDLLNPKFSNMAAYQINMAAQSKNSKLTRTLYL